MARDYKSRASRKRKKSLPGYIWLLSGLAIGLFIAFIIYLDKQPDSEKNFGTAIQEEIEKRKPQNKKKVTTKAKVSKEIDTTEKKEQKYDFYTLLREHEVFIPESETRPPETSTKTKKKSTANNAAKTQTSKQYILQVGSFQNLSDAKKLKVNLAFLGIAAHIQHVKINKQSWHRVRTNPYKNKKQLYKNQRTLKQNNIHAIAMELK